MGLNAHDNRLAIVARLAAKGIRKVPLRRAEAKPIPLWNKESTHA